MHITFGVIPSNTVAIFGVSAKTAREIKLSTVIFDGDSDFFFEFAKALLDVLDEADRVHTEHDAASPPPDAKLATPAQDPIAAAEYEEALVQKLRKAVRELFGAPDVAG